jgi:hypothetical protein
MSEADGGSNWLVVGMLLLDRDERAVVVGCGDAFWLYRVIVLDG